MTKSRDTKQDIRAYMRTHGVNYTTAKRALAIKKMTDRVFTNARQNPVQMIPMFNAPSIMHGPAAQADADARCTCAADEQYAGHPDGTTIHQWHATAIDPTTGERVPTTITEVRYPADATGRRRIETTTELDTTPNNLPDPQFVPPFHASQRIELIRTPTNTTPTDLLSQRAHCTRRQVGHVIAEGTCENVTPSTNDTHL